MGQRVGSNLELLRGKVCCWVDVNGSKLVYCTNLRIVEANVVMKLGSTDDDVLASGVNALVKVLLVFVKLGLQVDVRVAVEDKRKNVFFVIDQDVWFVFIMILLPVLGKIHLMMSWFDLAVVK